MSENHYDVISNIAGFTCVNMNRNKPENSKCKACKSITKCDVKEITLHVTNATKDSTAKSATKSIW